MKIKMWLVGFVLGCSSIITYAAVDIDKQAPDFSLMNIQGEQVSLSDFKGKKVILEWTNHLCPYVQKHYNSENMQNLQKTYTAEDVIWLSIISSAPGKQGHVSAEKADQLTKDRNASPTHVLFDENGEVGKMYAAKTTPHMYIVDNNGMLRYAGAIDSIKSADPADIAKADNYVKMGMASLASGQAIRYKKTAPYGCSIKYKS